MKIIITRTNIKEHTTDGFLMIDGQQICHTAEATATMLPPGKYQIHICKCGRMARKMPIVSITPTQQQCQLCREAVIDRIRAKMEIYDLLEEAIRDNCPESKLRQLEKVLDDDLRMNHSYMSRCPQIKVGNGVYNTTDGAILVGRFLQPGIVIRSREVFDRLYERMKKSISRGHKIIVVIQEKEGSSSR